MIENSHIILDDINYTYKCAPSTVAVYGNSDILSELFYMKFSMKNHIGRIMKRSIYKGELIKDIFPLVKVSDKDVSVNIRRCLK